MQLLLDTDIGDDVDDILALAYLVKSNKFKFAGITTVIGNTEKKAIIAKAFLEALGITDVPVYSGDRLGINRTPCQYEIVPGNFSKRINTGAAEYIANLASKTDGLTILTIGPLTNIKNAIDINPAAMSRVKFVIMGGMLTLAYPECNAATDPEATEKVFSSSADKVLVPLDVTLKCEVDHEMVTQVSKSSLPGLPMLSKAIKLWQKHALAPMYKNWNKTEDPYKSGTGAHDIIASMYLVRPDLFKTRQGNVFIETDGYYTRGVTIDDFNPFSKIPGDKRFTIVTDVDKQGFKEEFMSTILK